MVNNRFGTQDRRTKEKEIITFRPHMPRAEDMDGVKNGQIAVCQQGRILNLISFGKLP